MSGMILSALGRSPNGLKARSTSTHATTTGKMSFTADRPMDIFGKLTWKMRLEILSQSTVQATLALGKLKTVSGIPTPATTIVTTLNLLPKLGDSTRPTGAKSGDLPPPAWADPFLPTTATCTPPPNSGKVRLLPT